MIFKPFLVTTVAKFEYTPKLSIWNISLKPYLYLPDFFKLDFTHSVGTG